MLAVVVAAPARAGELAPKPYTPIGTAISGGTSAADGPLLRPGEYLDAMPRGSDTSGLDGTSKYYPLDLRTGQTPYVSATLVPPAERTSSASLELDVQIAPRRVPAASSR